jgi:hypothetical protein
LYSLAGKIERNGTEQKGDEVGGKNIK